MIPCFVVPTTTSSLYSINQSQGGIAYRTGNDVLWRVREKDLSNGNQERIILTLHELDPSTQLNCIQSIQHWTLADGLNIRNI